jgi:hypothetical protein
MSPEPKPSKWPILGRSNGHEWIKPDWLFVEACRHCGVARCDDDANMPCPGPVALDFREQTLGTPFEVQD